MKSLYDQLETLYAERQHREDRGVTLPVGLTESIHALEAELATDNEADLQDEAQHGTFVTERWWLWLVGALVCLVLAAVIQWGYVK